MAEPQKKRSQATRRGLNRLLCVTGGMEMNVEGLELITVGALQELFAINDLSIKEAMPIMREFRDKHGLTDKKALDAFNVAKKIFDA